MKHMKNKNVLLAVLATALCSCGNSFDSASKSLTDDSSDAWDTTPAKIGLFDELIELKNGGDFTVYGITFVDGLLKLSVYFRDISCKATDFSAYLEPGISAKTGFVPDNLDRAEGVIKLTLVSKLDENWADNLGKVKMDFLFNIPKDCITTIQGDLDKDKKAYYFLSTDFGFGPCEMWYNKNTEAEGATFKSFWQDVSADYILAGATGKDLPYEFKSRREEYFK